MADAPEKQFQPFVPDEANVAEFTPKAIVLGALFGVLFGAATVYLALRAGLTVSASIPIAVLAIAVFKRFGKSTILENNIVQTIGSAGESVAAGVVFTLPAFLFLAGGEQFFNYFNIFTLALVGGILGVLFMIPLRRSLIVKEHGNLLYPEGTACGEVLIAGEKGGAMAGRLFQGLGVAVFYKVLMSVLGLWKADPSYTTAKTAALPNAQINAEITPEYLGVGYIIGPKIAGQLVGGGVLAQLVLVPLIYFFGNGLIDALAPAGAGSMISGMSPGEIRLNYVRYIGAGAVAAAGFITLLRTLPTIVSAFKEGFAGMRGGGDAKAQRRTERDIPMPFVLFGSLALILIVAILPQIPGSFPGSILMGLLVIIFGFFFVTVSSRIVGIIGSSSNPISGMTIATLMATCVIFVALGWTGESYQAMALCVGGIVCIAAANAGATSQDLKTGYIVGGTPIYQQIGLIIGVLASVAMIGFTMNLLDQSLRFDGIAHAIGTDKFPAPQGTLMATIIKGLLAQDLPWALVFAGAAIAVVMELCGVHSLSFAVGAYLPLSTTAPIWAGGLMRALVDRRNPGAGDSEVSSGMLYSTGLVAGGSLAGVLIAGLSVIGVTGPDGKEMSLIQKILDLVGIHGWERLGATGDLIALGAFVTLCVLLVRAAGKKLEA
ncbi:MAG: oligopeptide transporter, OPT family [Acidobacteria bacterium]|nr:oligopeptide transporter, OPT family [Acidobacteriota bacterium]MCB9378757.1 oligopeptide transporter, OPT family [Holophagales bacterium]